MSAITIQKGNPYVDTITIKNADGTAYNLTGLKVLFTVKTKQDFLDDDSEALITQDITVHTNAAGGITTLSLSASQTNIGKGFYKADIRIYSSGGTQLNSDTFDCVVKDIVTKRTA